MATTPRLLFPDLPPELRNEVFRYLSGPGLTSAAKTAGLPLKLRTYECKHTTVQICPVHYGSTGLLALQTYGFQDANEYNSWLRNNAIELRIGVYFKSRVNTFVQQDWDNKMEAHLRKLAKLHPWLKKVAKYDIQILWSPIDGVMKSRGNKRTAGQIPKNMAATLTALMDADVKRKKGELKIKLCLEHKTAVEMVLSETRFGFAACFSPVPGGFRRETTEVWKETYLKPQGPEPGSLLLALPPAKQEDKSLIKIEKGSVEWTFGAQGNLVMKRHLLDGVVTGLVTGNEREKDVAVDHVVFALLGECLGQR
jgi:hypothetical protein